MQLCPRCQQEYCYHFTECPACATQGEVPMRVAHGPVMIEGEYPRVIETLSGDRLYAKAVGAFPYDCTSKREHPNAMVYYGATGGWLCLDNTPPPPRRSRRKQVAS